MFYTYTNSIIYLQYPGNSRRKRIHSFILTDNPPPPSSSVDNSSQDACNREGRNKIINARGFSRRWDDITNRKR